MNARYPIARLSVLALSACWSLGCVDKHASATEPPVPPIPADAAPESGAFCALPGSVVWSANGPLAVSGDAGIDLGWLHLPAGFCAHYFATVPKPRQLKFAPDGDLFVASPTTGTTGGAPAGAAAVMVLPDDNHDGVAEAAQTFLDGLASVQGLMFQGGYLYYQDGATIRRITRADGQRAASGAGEVVTAMGATWPQDSLHWPKVFDTAQDGTFYVTNGSTQDEHCVSTRPITGAIFKLNQDGSTSMVARGFRNPIALRCESDHNVCLALELAKDYSDQTGGREKLLVIHQGDDWGFPCCAAPGIPYESVQYMDTGATPDCSGIASESAAFVIGHTPFGIDIEPGLWPAAPVDGHPGATWNGRAFITLHGDYGTWSGARLVAVALDPATGLPLTASELAGTSAPADNLLDFATGWDDGSMSHGRPAPITFAKDGRMFVGDDQSGNIVWIAPVGLMRP